MQRTIDAPEREWLDMRALARWLGIGVKVIERLIEEGKIADGVRVGHKTRVWHWRDAVGISIVLSWESRKAKDGAEIPPSRDAP